MALHYAHTPGMARSLNRFVAELCATRPQVTGLATVFPGEPGAVQILEEGFEMGLSGVKLHCHVQGMGLDHPAMEDVYRTCAAHERPLVIHAGREPSSPAYPVDAHAICIADRLEEVLRSYPRLKICVLHLGADEFEAYGRLIERYDHLWLDTTMVLADYFPVPDPGWMLEVRPERVMYGTDFPNLPFAWDREVKRLVERGLSEDSLAKVLGGTAAAFYGLDLAVEPRD